MYKLKKEGDKKRKSYTVNNISKLIEELNSTSKILQQNEEIDNSIREQSISNDQDSEKDQNQYQNVLQNEKFFSSNQNTGGVLENVTEYTTFDPLLSDENYLDLHLNNVALENMCKKNDTNTIHQSQDPNSTSTLVI